MNTNLSIKTWAEDDRPREKMMLKGKSSLSDAELIAIIIGSGTPSKSAVQLAQEMLFSCNNDLQEFGRWNIKEMQKFKGIGQAKAISLMAAVELGRRRKDGLKEERLQITSARKAFDVLYPNFMDLAHEEFHVLLLNNSNRVIGTRCVSVGGLTGTVADGKIIFREAIAANACGIILAHNHPSGTLEPSTQDMRITKELKNFGKLIDIQILDHIIITDHGFFSFADKNMMDV